MRHRLDTVKWRKTSVGWWYTITKLGPKEDMGSLWMKQEGVGRSMCPVGRGMGPGWSLDVFYSI